MLRREGRFFEILFESEHGFHICESVLSELFRLKEKIARASELDEDSLARLYHEIISLLSIHKEHGSRRYIGTEHVPCATGSIPRTRLTSP